MEKRVGNLCIGDHVLEGGIVVGVTVMNSKTQVVFNTGAKTIFDTDETLKVKESDLIVPWKDWREN